MTLITKINILDDDQAAVELEIELGNRLHEYYCKNMTDN